MQKMLRKKLVAREAAVEILINYWDKIQGKLSKFSMNKPDKDIKLFLKHVTTIRLIVKQRVLADFIQACKMINHVAFEQWRYMYSAHTSTNWQSEELIQKVLKQT